jgi:serine/threonine-protein kinase
VVLTSEEAGKQSFAGCREVITLIGQVVSHFKIEEHLGSGGMAEVYLASDLNLGRPVALKFLPASRRRDTVAREQLLQEARAASKLDHRNICTIHEVSETEGGDLFIAMAFYQGETLNSRIGRSPLPVLEAVEIATQVARGLHEAHQLGVVHRDVKPSNIMLLPGGEVKILDFGIAQLSDRALASASTNYGTLTYMAPERVAGNAGDHRSDLWSLGVALYKMISGMAPFRGVSLPELADAIQHHQPLTLIRNLDTPAPGLASVLLRAMAKDHLERYQSAREMEQDLETVAMLLTSSANGEVTEVIPSEAFGERLGAFEAKSSEPSIAVLPFKDFSDSQDQEYFCSGMAEELIHLLTRVKGLRVASRNAAHDTSLAKGSREIGRRLQVGHILHGSVQKVDKRLRVTVKLSRVADGRYLWTERYDRDLEDLFDIQDEIARSIVGALEVTLIGSPPGSRPDARGLNFEAHNLYLKGRYHWNKRSREEIELGIDYFQRAIAEEPRYARAYAGLADSYAMLGIYGAVRPKEVMPHAEKAAERALSLDDSLAEVYVARALVRAHFDWDFDRAESDFRQALERDSWYATGHQQYAMACLIPQSRFDDAFEQLRRARQLDPLSLPIHTSLGLAFFFSRQYQAAAVEFARVLEVEGAFVRLHMFLGQVHEARGDLDAALLEMLQAVNLAEGAPAVTAALGRTYALLGEEKHARSFLVRLHKTAQKRHVSSTLLAQIHIGLGDHALAIHCLEEAWRQKSADLIWLGVHPLYDPLRKEPRFHELLKKLKLPRRPSLMA